MSILSKNQAALALTLSLNGSCASHTALVPQGDHIATKEPTPLEVHEAPPPAKVEVLPLRRNQLCYYLDGKWEPNEGKWSWAKGAWVLPPHGCYYAAPQTTYERLGDGTILVHRPGVWHPRSSAISSCERVQPCPEANSD